MNGKASPRKRAIVCSSPTDKRSALAGSGGVPASASLASTSLGSTGGAFLDANLSYLLANLVQLVEVRERHALARRDRRHVRGLAAQRLVCTHPPLPSK